MRPWTNLCFTRARRRCHDGPIRRIAPRTPIQARRCTGGRSDRPAPAERARCPAPASRMSPMPASTTAACGARPTTAPPGSHSSTRNRPARSARSRSRRPIPNIIYVGTGAGIIRPDLATGDGMYKSTDAGKTWTHLGLATAQMIAHIDVDPAIRTGCSSRCSDIRTARIRSAASSARPTAARRSRRCSLKTTTRAATTSASTRAIRRSSMRRCGNSSRRYIEGGGFGGAGRRPRQRHLQVN